MGFRVQYKGTMCVVCGKEIAVGTMGDGKKGAYRHECCKPVELPADAIHLNGGSGYGCPGWERGQVVWNTGGKLGSTRERSRQEIDQLFAEWRKEHPEPSYEAMVNHDAPKPPRFDGKGGCDSPEYLEYRRQFAAYGEEAKRWREQLGAEYEERRQRLAAAVEEDRRLVREALAAIQAQFPEDDGPAYLFVLQASKQYHREDGMSFGVGDESGHTYSAACRPATDEEAAPLRAKIAEAQQAKHKAMDLKVLEERFIKEGEYVARGEDGQAHILNGEQVNIGSGQSIYGGGRWFMIEAAGERAAPAPEEIEAVRAEVDRRKHALKTASERLIAWVQENLPATAPIVVANKGRWPYDGHLYSDGDLAALGEKRPTYEALLKEEQRLSYTTSPDSYHEPQRRLMALEQALALSRYPRSIWHVLNNGSDGDDWSANNVRTGGAGAIGRRLPYSPELDAQVRELAPFGPKQRHY